jgi:hypothetical protein
MDSPGGDYQMDMNEVRRIVREVVESYAVQKPSNGEVDVRAVIIPEEDFYGVLFVGWDGHRRVHGLVIHIDIIGDKVWIQYDGTSTGVANDLLREGIPPEMIVLAWQPARLREHTGFAVR